ncbi:hypothetical protein Bca52824_001403 [Brassica carinata]|uniref:Uncharacterized protein n=1 Tax=Brassica carinata TaxID=52824 RepID=A0A8X7WLG2_BRACI|nr:hypothetical protein Bca52824_001403 [Brassica carinata]
MTHPDEENRQMKASKNSIDMLGFAADAHCWIPTRCPCGGENHQRGGSGPEILIFLFHLLNLSSDVFL